MKVSAQFPDGSIVWREIEDHGEAVSILPYDPARRTVLLVRQPRVPVTMCGEADPIEACAGLIDEGETPEVAVRREALEELGLAVGSVELLASSWSMAAISTEKVHLYLAPYHDADRVGPGGGLSSEHENITVLEVPMDDILYRARTGRLTDMKTMLLVLALKDRCPELFST